MTCCCCDDPTTARCHRCGEWFCTDCVGNARMDDGEPICPECEARYYEDNLLPQGGTHAPPRRPDPGILA